MQRVGSRRTGLSNIWKDIGGGSKRKKVGKRWRASNKGEKKYKGQSAGNE